MQVGRAPSHFLCVPEPRSCWISVPPTEPSTVFAKGQATLVSFVAFGSSAPAEPRRSLSLPRERLCRWHFKSPSH